MESTSTDATGREGWGVFPTLVVLFLVISLVAGGSSSNVLSAGLARVCGVPILALATWRMFVRPVSPGAGPPLAILIAAAALVVAQMIPLPPALWEGLPGRQTVVDGYAAAGIALPWLPLSLTPASTWDAGLGLIPPAAMFCAVLTLGAAARRALAATVLAMAAASVVLGMLQMSGGPDSPLRFYSFTNDESAVGFFANRNHQAALLATSLPFAAALTVRHSIQGGTRSLFWAAAAGAFALVMVVGVAVSGSRAGVALLGLGLLGAMAITFRARRGAARGLWSWAPIAALAAAILLAGGLVAISGNTALAQRVEDKFGQDLRFELTPAVARDGLVFAPLGSGIGSFVDVYQMFERPETLTPAYVNHAHDEYVEVWMEAGVPGVALIAAFVAWWVVSGQRVLRRKDAGAGLALAGATVVGMLLAHSIVDYPLRTPAMAVVFALACGLMAPPRRSLNVG